MTDQNDDQFDARLRGHFAAELDPQRGRAARAFAARLSDEAALGDEAGPFPIRRPARLMSGRTLAFVGTAMAAAVAAVVVGPAFMPEPAGGRSGPVIRPQVVDSPPLGNPGPEWERRPDVAHPAERAPKPPPPSRPGDGRVPVR